MPDQAAAEPLTNPSLSSIAATARTEGVKVDAKLDASEKRQKDTLDTMLATKPPEPTDYQVDKPTPPPQTPPQTDPFQAFGSPAGWIAAFGSLLSRRPLITALNSATAVMKAAKENDQEAFKRHREAWKESSEYAQQLSDWQMNRYEMAFDKYKNDQDKLRSTLTVLSSQDQNTLMRQAAHSDDAMTMWKAFEDQKNKAKEFSLRHEELAARIQQHEDAMRQHTDQMEMMGWSVLTDPTNQKQFRYNSRTGQATDLQGQPYQPSGAAKLQGQPRSAPAMAMSKFMEEHKDATSDDLMNFGANYRARGAAVTAFATGKQGDIVRSFSVATSHLDTLDHLADALANSDNRTFNRLANAFAHEFNATAPVDFQTAKQVVGAELIKAVVGAGGTGEDRSNAQGVLDNANTPAQLKSATVTIRELIKGQLAGLRQQYVDTTGKTGEDFDKRLSGAAAKALGVGQDKPSAGGGASAEIDAKAKEAWGSYEPDKYDYRVNEGVIQRRAKDG